MIPNWILARKLSYRSPDIEIIYASPLFFTLVLIQQMSSHRLKPQFWRQRRPRSNPSLDPHHKNMKERGADTSTMSNAMILSQSQNFVFVTPYVRLYSSKGGSIRITSNLAFSCLRSYVSRSHLRYMGGCAVLEISSSLSLINSCSLGYSSNLPVSPVSLIKFCGRWPVSTKFWL